MLQVLLLTDELADLLSHYRAKAVEELIELLGLAAMGECLPADVHLSHGFDDLFD